jgi:hypothetical protein
MRRLVAIGMFGLALGLPASARGDGAPAGPLVGGAGATAPHSRVAYATVRAGRRTLLERVERAGGAVDSTALLTPGDLDVTRATFAGDGTGLSADGRTLVLARFGNAWPIRRSAFAVVDARHMRIRARFALRGYSVVDAVSPDGRWLYLLHYPSAANYLNYEVRAYDLRTRRLLTRPVVDPREPDEKMAGLPLMRTTSADGRWVYTLYEGDTSFVHALDTSTRVAYCVDMPKRFDATAASLRLTGGGRTLSVTAPRQRVTVDTRTFATSVQPRARAAATGTRRSAGGGGPGWALLLIAAPALLAAIGFAAARRRGPRPVTAVD